jgi:TPR repeat protein
MAASQSHPSALYNLGRCFEYGKGVRQDFDRAVTYYRLGAELGDSAAQNSFGIFLERGIGIQPNLALAAQYYKLAAAQGHPDGANNLGFCLEHGRGVEPNIEAAADCSRFAANHGHSEAKINYRRCLRLLGRWAVPDRFDSVSDRFTADARFAKLFIDCLEDREALEGASPELVASIQRLKTEMGGPADSPRENVKLATVELSKKVSSVVRLEEDSRSTLTAVKTAFTGSAAESIEREIAILKN